uniref:BCL2-interacting killer n=1 Tax=Jaculus jaculus TaxID=51337 RepID=A0A8C5KS51_JACJA
MSEARPISGNVFTETFLHQQALGAPVITEPVGEEDLPPVGDLDLMECLEGSNQVALRLACIGDEMDLRLRSPRLVQLPGMAMHSLAVTYGQTGVSGVLRSLVHGLIDLSKNLRCWSLPTPSAWVHRGQVCRQLPPLLLALLLLGGALHLLLQ